MMETACYEINKTMQMLGEQSTVAHFWNDDQVREEIKDISKGRPHSFTLEAASDIFMLGYIHGKRAERARKRDR